MAKYIIIVNEDLSAKEKDRITHYFQQHQANIWHWISNVWLIIDEQKTLERNQIRQDLMNLISAGPVLVFETNEPNLCSGFAPQTQAQWIMKNWVSEEIKF
ncbi:hypothetical protein [Lonepinella sp. BR2474]|uniref:hypothetical protein n=1 Tax=Lonepinella sp. BR2474 TaxID=3434548 RepID=UPI003F6DFB95